jgi:hypothetical protein
MARTTASDGRCGPETGPPITRLSLSPSRLATSFDLLSLLSSRHQLRPDSPAGCDGQRPQGCPVSPIAEGLKRATHIQDQDMRALLAALDVHPRVAMQILRHSKIAVTMEIYTEAPRAPRAPRSGSSAGGCIPDGQK